MKKSLPPFMMKKDAPKSKSPAKPAAKTKGKPAPFAKGGSCGGKR